MTLLDEHRLTPDGRTEAEALIEEARQRQRKRRLLVGSIVLVVAVAAGVWAASDGGSATKPPSSSKKPGHTKTAASTPSPRSQHHGVRHIACGPGLLRRRRQRFLDKVVRCHAGVPAGKQFRYVWVDAVGGGANTPGQVLAVR